MKKILVIGCGVSGRAVIDFCLKRGLSVFCVDRDPTKDVPCPLYKEDYLFTPFDFDLVLVSPGVKLDHFQIVCAKKKGVRVIGETEFALEQIDNYAIGITGTNGKSSVVSMIAHVLNSCGKKAFAVGNIGTPIISLVNDIEKEDILVVELSSFQLLSMKAKSLDVAIVLNISQDHIDWHGSFSNYKQAKLSIRNLLKDGGLYLENITNAKALSYVCKNIGVSKEEIEEGLTTFQSLKHRLEFVTEINGVRCVNDSKATNIASLQFALESVDEPIVLICGGRNKGISMASIREDIEKWCRCVILIGENKSQIASELKEGTAKVFADTMQDAIQKGLQHANRGDTLLLAPGCSSFDMFDNFMVRGEEFKRGIIDESKRYNSSCSTC